MSSKKEKFFPIVRVCTETPRRRIVNETADNLFWASSLVLNTEPEVHEEQRTLHCYGIECRIR